MKKGFSLLMVAFAMTASFCMTGCNKEYTLTVNPNNPEWGSTEGSGVYTSGTNVEISATPKPGYYFIKWNDNVTDSVRTITVTGDATYTAYFSNNPNGGGTPGGGETENIYGSWRGYNGGNEYTLDLGTQGWCSLEIVYNIDTDEEEIVHGAGPYTYANGSGSFDLSEVDPDLYDLHGHGTFTVSGNTLTMSYGGATVSMTHAK